MNKPPYLRFFDWLFRDNQGRIVVIEIPNIPLLVAVVAWILSHVITNQTSHTFLEIVFNGSLAVWAILEIGWGSTKFRQLLGGGILAILAYNLLRLFL